VSDRPERRYRFTFVHPLLATVVMEQQGETRCIARGVAWQALEAQLAASAIERDHYWQLAEQLVLSVVSIP